jgi:hypothetical protein
MTTCPHPPEQHYAWAAYDSTLDDDVLCLGCTACGAILSGAVDIQGEPVGPQRPMLHDGKLKKRKRAKKK